VVSSPVLPTLRTAAIRESVADLLRRALIDGKFRPGESLSEPALAAQLGVSRGPVREALLVLAQEGLVLHSQNRGFSVLTLTPADREQMVVVRLPLESLALQLARPAAKADELAALDEIKRKLLDSILDPVQHARNDKEFHERIWALSRNSWLELTLRRLMTPFFTFTMMFRERSGGLLLDIIDQQHQAYLDYLRGTTPMTAEECVALHLRLYKES
jgi:DNA-binding GntR family transcriptional regulator